MVIINNSVSCQTVIQGAASWTQAVNENDSGSRDDDANASSSAPSPPVTGSDFVGAQFWTQSLAGTPPGLFITIQYCVTRLRLVLIHLFLYICSSRSFTLVFIHLFLYRDTCSDTLVSPASGMTVTCLQVICHNGHCSQGSEVPPAAAHDWEDLSGDDKCII